jgi:hypothetical protein
MRAHAPLLILALAVGGVGASIAADVSDPPPPCADAMKRVLGDFARIAPGVTTKADLQRFLHEDGGVFTPRSMRFVHPQCSYCKVEVTFDPIRDAEGRMVGSDSDVVVQVSNPYLEPMFID